MKKKLFILTAVSLIMCLIGFVAVSYACDGKGGKSKHGYLNLYEKTVPVVIPDPANPIIVTEAVCLDEADPNVTYSYPCAPVNDLNWSKVSRGASGKMEYKFVAPIFQFEFDGKRLDSGESYTLIYYPDNWGQGSGLIYLGSDVADNHGNVHIAGSLDTGDLPALYDENCVFDSTGTACTEDSGAKFWLVPTTNVEFKNASFAPSLKVDSEGKFNLGKYLFPEKLIRFDSP